mmetsp:Transcript_174479/g.553851  ORF Transcript_174479/g.553851 Transcript_174479/m.553851 type:complete len:343 (-) Transcript_174479:9-1037(-)
MVTLGIEERGCRDNLRGDLPTARGLRRLELGLILVAGGLGKLLLGFGVVVDARPVLGAPVASLLVLRGGVVALPEHLQQVTIRDHLGVVHDSDDLVVAGPAGAHVAVGGVVVLAARVAHLRGVDALLGHVQVLGAPEATHAEHGHLHPRRPRRVHRIAGEEMSGVRGRRIWDRRIAARGRAAEDGTGHPGASSRAGGDAQSASNEAARQQAAASSDESQGKEARALSHASGDAQRASNEAARQQAAASSDECQGREARTSSRASGDAQRASNEAARQQAAASSDESQGSRRTEARTSRDTATAGKAHVCPSDRCQGSDGGPHRVAQGLTWWRGKLEALGLGA